MRRCAKLTVLLLLSGAAAIAVAEEKAPTEAGWVRLPLPEYDRLLRAARRPLEKAPLDAAMTSSVTVLEAEGASPRLQTTLELISLSDKPQALSLPDLGVLYAADASGDGASMTTGDSGQLQVALARRGRFTLRLHSVPVREDKAGTLVLSWSVPDTPSNRFTARLPPGHENVTLTGGTVSVASDRSGPVRVTGTLRRGETARLSYAVAASRAPEEKLLASASESRLYRLGEKSLGIASRLRIEVLRGTLRTFAVEAAADLTVTSAWAAENTVTSFERDPDHPGRLVLTLGRGVTGGTAEVFWLLERPARQDKAELPLPDIGLPDFLRGETAVAVISPRPLVLDEACGKREGYERIDEADLPAELREMADSTVLLALRRIGAGTPSLSIQVSSFPDATGLSGVIDRAKVLTIAARDGSRIDRWQLEVQTRESFIRIPLPPNATLWSLQVDGKPARPLTEQGQLVIPLGRGEKAARSRRIEIVLAMPGAFKLSGRGTARIEVPKLPFPITHTDWDLLLPETAQFRYAGGSVVPMPLPVEQAAAEPSGTANGLKGSLSLNNSWNLDGVAVQGPGQLSGRVVDEQGAALPGVTVTLIRQEGSYQRNVMTNAQGLYFFSGVPTGTFRIVASLPGFGNAERSLAFSEGGDVAADFKLPLAQVNAEVTVMGEGALADKTMSSIRPAAPPPARRDAAKDNNRQSLSNEERASLQRTSEAGVAAIAVELPTEGKRLHFEGNLLVDEAPLIELEFRPVKRGWL